MRSRLAVHSGDAVLLGAGGSSAVEEVARHRGPISLLAAGKAAAAMATAAVEILEVPGAGPAAVAIGPPGLAAGHGVQLHEGGHPLPTRHSLAATRAACDQLIAARPDALILVLLSGGASALLVRPTGEVTLEDKAAVTDVLLACGASIAEINTVRKHLSDIKGGGLVRLVAPRRVWALILSDVVGDEMATIASGPTAPDPTTFADALNIVARYDLAAQLPAAALTHLRDGAAGRHAETPKPGDSCFRSVSNVIIGSNRVALAAASSCAAALGQRPLVIEEPVTGDTTAAAEDFARTLVQRQRDVREPTCVIAGGETTLRVHGRGRGGRNQEFALVVALALAGIDGVHLLSAGTDGIDGPTDAAGAFASGRTVPAALSRGLDGFAALRDNDSYGFFETVDGLFRPGATGTNVMDLKLALLEPHAA
jgi:glycerate 2-kinase